MKATDSAVYYVRLRYLSGSISGDVNCNITLVNSSLASSTPIRIVSGSVTSGETSMIELNSSFTGYSSGYIKISALKSVQDNSTLKLALDYCTSPGMSTCVTYTMILVLDPPPIAQPYGNPSPHTLQTSGEPLLFQALHLERLHTVIPEG